MLKDVLTKKMLEVLPPDVTEVRLRRGGPLVYLTKTRKYVTQFFITHEDFEAVLSVVTEHSLYALTEKMVNGYIPLKGGIRVGIAGEGVMDGEKVKTVKNVTSLVLRIPHQVFGIADFLGINGNFGENILVVSPPGAGKTTLLREIARRLSEEEKTVVILDERGELSGATGTKFSLSLGRNTDVLFGFPKRIAYENALRALSPEYIVTDELSGEQDVLGVMRAFYGGVKVVATLHGNDENVFHGVFSPLKTVFDHLIVLTKEPKVGTLKKEIKR